MNPAFFFAIPPRNLNPISLSFNRANLCAPVQAITNFSSLLEKNVTGFF